MIPAKLSSNPQYGYELCQPDRNGHRLPRDQQTHIVMQVPIHCTSEDKQIDLAFYVWGQVPIAQANAVTDELARGFSVAATVARSAFSLLPKWRQWPWYGVSEIQVTVSLEEVSNCTPSISADVQIVAELAEALREESKRRSETERAFEKAKDYIYDSMGSSLYGQHAQIRSAAQFIEACRGRAALSYGDFMDDSRHDKLMPYIDHLLRLKNPAHPNVRAAEQARTLVYLSRCPEFWRETPPRPTDFSLDWLS